MPDELTGRVAIRAKTTGRIGTNSENCSFVELHTTLNSRSRPLSCSSKLRVTRVQLVIEEQSKPRKPVWSACTPCD